MIRDLYGSRDEKHTDHVIEDVLWLTWRKTCADHVMGYYINLCVMRNLYRSRNKDVFTGQTMSYYMGHMTGKL